ncbi:MAG TPA: preprotein translocase subunit SecG [Verrucomicrobiae bacterium]
MAIVIGLLTAVLVVTGLFLGLLVLIQLPKKEAGAGAAFGGGMTDAVMGAGSGNVLTTATRYSVGVFLSACLLLSILKTNEANAGKNKFDKELQQVSATTPSMVTPPPATLTNTLAPAAPKTNAVPAKPTEAPSAFPGATPTAPGESLFPGATPTAPGESLFPGATPTAPQ